MNKYINVKVAKEYLRHDSFSNPYFRSQACQQAIDVLDTVPAADVVEVIHAHWIDENPEDLLDVRMRCSNCRTIHAPYAHWHYCPSCGATMDEILEERNNI